MWKSKNRIGFIKMFLFVIQTAWIIPLEPNYVALHFGVIAKILICQGIIWLAFCDWLPIGKRMLLTIDLWIAKKRYKSLFANLNWQRQELPKYGLKWYCKECKRFHYLYKDNGMWNVDGKQIFMIELSGDIKIDDYYEITKKKVEALDK